ncbi:MAG: M20/M25/M40 family metallo-hydrolase [Bacteroidota bacterium]|nr:M20/M25/M40 family metallo-hydrolase [Bacteroidota bacterium]
MKYLSSILFPLFLLSSIFITSCTKDDNTESRKEITTLALTTDVSADSLKKYVMWLEEKGTRFALADNHRRIAVDIRNKYVRLGYSDTRLDSFLINKTYNSIAYEQWQYNVIATLEGSTNPDSVCIVGAHYDNILKSGAGDPFLLTYGANDNASGVAAAFELARVMKKNHYSPKNTIRFIAFSSEEIGLLGSSYQAGKSRTKGEKIKIMLNNDMIAYEPGSDKSGWIVNIMDYDNSTDLMNKVQLLAEKYTVLKYVNDNSLNKKSDSYPYSANGFKALFFISASNDPNYHTLNDISAYCNFEYCREIVNISCAILVDSN